jgi:hypothetical protein
MVVDDFNDNFRDAEVLKMDNKTQAASRIDNHKVLALKVSPWLGSPV